MAHQYGEQEEPRGFIASTFGCCAPTLQQGTQEKNASQWATDSSQEPVTMTFEQPPIEDPNPKFTRPPTSHSMARSSFWSIAVSTTEERPRKLTRRPRTATYSTFGRPWTSAGTRPRISAPMDFRRVSDPWRVEREPGIRKLELSIYLPAGRLSPLPDFSTFDWQQPSDLAMPKAAFLKPDAIPEEDVVEDTQSKFQIRRKPLSVSSRTTSHRRSSTFSGPISVDNGPGPTLQREDWYNSLPGLAPVSETSPLSEKAREEYLITLPSRHRASSASRPSTAHTPMRIASPEPIRGHSRSLTETVRSPVGARRSKTNDTIDEAIRELNTIVEERRASALQRSNGGTAMTTPVPGSPSQHHIPAIAPSMRLRARSETLTDIGSAFSIPLSSNPPVMSPGRTISPTIPVMSPPAAVLKNNPKNRLRTWIKRTTGASTPPTPISPQPFYQCGNEQPAETYSNISSPTLSTISTLSSCSEAETSPIGSYPATTVTALSTPLDFGPTPQKFDLETEPAPRPSTSTTTSISNRVLRSMQKPFMKRGLSIDTTHTTSSVGTSILGGAEIRESKDEARYAYPVGVAY